ncbi:hypothetical protein HKX48_001084 [Thoreauomyces humboldtii]|nr:hypothetical protein HKX48_001084 [Thoreauomyces humboldtii]
MKPTEKMQDAGVSPDRQPIYDVILEYLAARRKDPALSARADDAKRPFPVHTVSDISKAPELIRQIDTYIQFINLTSANIAGNREDEEPSISIGSVEGSDIRKEHLRAHRRARGAWWESSTEDEWQEWIEEGDGAVHWETFVTGPDGSELKFLI